MTISNEILTAQSDKIAGTLMGNGNFPTEEAYAEVRAWTDQYMYNNEFAISVSPTGDAARLATAKLEEAGALKGLVLTDLSNEVTAIHITGGEEISYTQQQLTDYASAGQQWSEGPYWNSSSSQMLAQAAAERFAIIDTNSDGTIVASELSEWAQAPQTEQSFDALPETDSNGEQTSYESEEFSLQQEQLPSNSAPSFYTVQSGDNLWNIAEGALEGRLGYSPSNAEILAETSRLTDLNGLDQNGRDPSLIYPGEQLLLEAATETDVSDTEYAAQDLEADLLTMNSFSNALRELDQRDKKLWHLGPWRFNGSVSRDGLSSYIADYDSQAKLYPDLIDENKFPPSFVESARRLEANWTSPAVQERLENNKLRFDSTSN